MNILGIEFDEQDSLDFVVNELKRRGINPDNRVIPVLYRKEINRISHLKLDMCKSAQELIDSCDE